MQIQRMVEIKGLYCSVWSDKRSASCPEAATSRTEWKATGERERSNVLESCRCPRQDWTAVGGASARKSECCKVTVKLKVNDMMVDGDQKVLRSQMSDMRPGELLTAKQ